MSARIPIPTATTAELPQLSSHFPAIPPPVDVVLTVLPPQPCPYFSDRVSRVRAIQASRIDPDVNRDFMDSGFRRSGRMLYQPICSGCRDCMQIRLETQRFEMTGSQRRVWRRNADLRISTSAPRASDEKFDLYCRYLRDRHDGQQDDSRLAFESFLYQSPTRTVEFEYRLPDGRLSAVGICDVGSNSLSSVYFYYDPDLSRRRSLGTFGVLAEIAYARGEGLWFYYLGYWVARSATMDYKARFGPHQLLGGDGHWREAGQAGDLP